MLQYKLTLHKEVKYYLGLLLILSIALFFTIEPNYKSYVLGFIGAVLGFGLALFSVKRLFRVKLFNIYQDEVELANQAELLKATEYQHLFRITTVFIKDIKAIKTVEELDKRVELYLKALNNHPMREESDIASYAKRVQTAQEEIKDAVKRGENISTNYPEELHKAFAHIVEKRLSKENKDILREIKDVKY